MTLGLTEFLRLLATCRSWGPPMRGVTPLDLHQLSARDLADLNLPSAIAARLEAKRVEDAMRNRF